MGLTCFDKENFTWLKFFCFLLAKLNAEGKKVSWKAYVIAVSVLLPISALLCYLGRKLKLKGIVFFALK